MVWAIINALITLALMPFAPKRASRIGIIGPSILIALATVIVGYAGLWLADLRSRSISGSGSSRSS